MYVSAHILLRGDLMHMHIVLICGSEMLFLLLLSDSQLKSSSRFPDHQGDFYLSDLRNTQWSCELTSAFASKEKKSISQTFH